MSEEELVALVRGAIWRKRQRKRIVLASAVCLAIALLTWSEILIIAF